MFLAKVEGSVVATKKDANMTGRKLLLIRPQLVDDKDPTRFKAGSNTLVAVDSVGAGEGELVSVHVIARPHADVEAVLPKRK